jgi:aquaporin Z
MPPCHSLRKALLAEWIGTFALVFAGTTAVVVHQEGRLAHEGVALTFGLVVFAMIASLGDISGAHLNPAVTIALAIAGRFDRHRVMPYLGSQCLGAILASTTVRLLFPQSSSLGGTVPAGSDIQSWGLEFLLTAGLMFVILGVSTGSPEKSLIAGPAIGAVVGLEAMFAGPVSGASMNPARSLGPALVSGQVDHLWIYLTAPVLGAISAVGACRCVRDESCCPDWSLFSCPS